MSTPQVQRIDTSHDGFLLILPEIGRLLRWCFRYEQPDQREELVQEALCKSWAMYVRAFERGKQLAAHGLAWYSWLATKSGRRFCAESKRSVQNWVSIDTVDPDALLAADWHERWPVADAAAFRIDWPEFVNRQTDEEARAIGALAVGFKRCEAAELIGVSPAWMTVHMARLWQDWEDSISE